MIQNDYAALLDADTITVKHPITKKNIKLHRIIALKTFKLDRYDSVIINELESLTEKSNYLNETITQFQEQQENYRITINDLMLKEEFHRVKELQSELDHLVYNLEKLQIEHDNLNLKILNCSNILDTKTVEQYAIGGYVQSIDNLDPNVPVWVDHRARVFDSAKILNGSLVTESCVIYGDVEIDSSRIKNYARVHGKSKVLKSTIKDLAEIKGNVTIYNCQVGNSAMIFENATVNNSILETGSCIRGNAVVDNSILKDASQIQGVASVTNCTLGGRAVILEGTHIDSSYYEDFNLKTQSYSE